MRFKDSPRKGHYMPELVASSDQSRPVLTQVHLNAERSAVEVTDAYMIARFPVELDEGDTSGPIPVEALKASRKSPFKLVSGTSIRCNAHVEVRAAFGEDASDPYVTLPRESGEYIFPNVDQLIPDESSMHEFEIGIDAAKLAKLAKAMGDDVVRLRFVATKVKDSPPNTWQPSPLRPILVNPGNLPNSEDQPQGLIMPVRLS
jgi:hypothetical protein